MKTRSCLSSSTSFSVWNPAALRHLAIRMPSDPDGYSQAWLAYSPGQSRHSGLRDAHHLSELSLRASCSFEVFFELGHAAHIPDNHILVKNIYSCACFVITPDQWQNAA